MTKFSKFFFSIFVLLLMGLAAFAYPIIKSRYFSENPPVANNEVEIEKENEADNMTDGENGSKQEEKEPVEEETPSGDEDLVDEFLEIAAGDCENECADWTEEADLNYCREVCGLAGLKNSPADERCDDMSGLEKDYCFKNLAVKNNDSTLCAKISDKNVAKSCRNRLWENVLENSPSLQ